MTETTENTESTNTGFGIQDLVFTLQVYEACTQRGAFRADELSNIGSVYDRLRAFLIANGAVPNPATGMTETPTTQPGE